MSRGEIYKNCDGCMYAGPIGSFTVQGCKANRICLFIDSGHAAIIRDRMGFKKLDLRGYNSKKCLLKDTRKVKQIPYMSDEEYQKKIDRAIKSLMEETE